MLHRLRADFQLTILSLFGACAVAGLLPFAVYRFLTGALVVGLVDSFLVLGISAAVIYAWRTGDTRRPGLFMALVDTAGSITTATILGEPGRDWMYVALMSNFFLIDRRLAAIASVVALLITAISGKSFETPLHLISFLITASLVSAFAFIFAARSESQRVQLEELATHDPLTGVDNRRAMEDELPIAVETFRRSHAECGLVMFDLDHFKSVNDGYGHDAGDRVLIACADLIRKSTRKVDRLFRYGGEEFVILLPGINLVSLHHLAENLRNKIAAELRGPAGPVTCSLGAAVLRPGEDWPSWLARADAALYRAKACGRNCAVVDGVDAAAPP